MGRKTHESIGRPLPGRRNIIISRNPDYRAEGCVTAFSLPEAYQKCTTAERVFNIGGEQLYRQGIHDANKLILTVLQQDIPGNTFFPSFSATEFKLINTEEITQTVAYTIKTYERINTSLTPSTP